MPKQYISATLKKQDGKVTFVATDETLDRMGDVLKIEDWDLTNYKKNPVLLVNHDYKVENIVGAAMNLRKQNKQLLFDPVFHGITEKSREVRDMVEGEWLNTVSVGFMMHPAEKEGQRPGMELFEISFVPVPANPSAERIKQVLEKSVNKAEEIEQVKEWAEKQRTTTEVQTVICAKEVFKTEQDAKTWVTSHDFRADKVDETDDSFRFRQFEPSACQTDTFRTIDITDGVKAVVCKPKKSADEPMAVPLTTEKDLIGALIGTKDGNAVLVERALLNGIITARDRAAADLAKAREDKDGNGDKGRKPKGERGPAPKVPSAVVRALQRINRESNDLLRNLK